MKPISEAWLCQIDITNFCGRGCVYCSRYDRHIRQDQRFNMNLEFFEKAVLSLKDFPGKIGIIGGEPVYHPKFKEICFLLQKLLSKERRQGLWLWSSGGVLFEKYKMLIKETFAGVAYNPHTEYQQGICKHQPITVAVEDVVEPGVYRDKLINDCWVQKTWCPTITSKGAFFCEVAGALDMILDGLGGYTIEPEWWGRTPEEFQDQIDRYCLYCGMPVPMERQLLKNKKEKFSLGLLKLFKEHGLPKLTKDYVEVFDKRFTVEEIEEAKKIWDPGNYRGDKHEDKVL